VPSAASETPEGRIPAASDHANVSLPPVALRLELSAMPTSESGSPPESPCGASAVTISGALTSNRYSRPVERFCVSLTVTVKVKEPLVTGVPAIAPVAAFSWRPGGTVPPVSAHVWVPAGVALSVAV
jgi:hypothetical protein